MITEEARKGLFTRADMHRLLLSGDDEALRRAANQSSQWMRADLLELNQNQN